MNSKRSISLSTVAFAAIAILFASGPILGDKQGLAANLCGSGLGCGFGGYGFHHHFYPYYGGYGFHHHFYPYYGGYDYELPFP